MSMIRSGSDQTLLDDEIWDGSLNRESVAGAVLEAELCDTTAQAGENSGHRHYRLRTLEELTSPREDWADQVERMHAVIVAGEHSWGGGIFEELGCRPLMEVAGRPLVVHILEWLRLQGIRSAGICVNTHGRELRQCLGDGQAWGISLNYYTDVMPRGPAGCVRDAAIDAGSDHVVVVTGMVVPRRGILEAYRQHRETDAAVTVLSSPGCGRSLEANGVYIFNSDAFAHIPATGYQDIKETLLPQIRRAGGRVQMHCTLGDDFPRITDLKSYVLVNRRLIEESLDSLTGPEYIRMGDCWVHRACSIDPGARLVGPALIGAGSNVEAGAVIIGPTCIGTGCHIGPGAVVCRSSLWAFSQIGRGAFVDNCLLAQNSVVGEAVRARDTLWARGVRSGTPPAIQTGIPCSAVQRLAS